MDSLVTSAARALAAGDPLGALKRIALRDDPPALALRGVAMAQLGDHDRARALLVRAAAGFGPRERLARARCQVAVAEIALASRELDRPGPLPSAIRTLEARGDRANAALGRLVAARRALLVGEVDAAARGLAALSLDGAPPAVAARAALTAAEIAIRQVRAGAAAAALVQARSAADASAIPALVAEVAAVQRTLLAPSARIVHAGAAVDASLADVEALLGSRRLVVDACRRAVRGPGRSLELARRPVLFAIARGLAEAWPAPADRDQLITRVFAARAVNPSHRARLRVEIGRLRAALRGLAAIEATATGFALSPTGRAEVVVLAPLVDGESGEVLALLADGEAWSTSALARALGASQRTVQRALRELEAADRVRSVGAGRTRRWLAPSPSGFATPLLLPGALPIG
jgi:DNA-binding transcriptional ArsR family regulator